MTKTEHEAITHSDRVYLNTDRWQNFLLDRPATTQLRALLRFSHSVAGEEATRRLMPLSELCAEIEAQTQRQGDLVRGRA